MITVQVYTYHPGDTISGAVEFSLTEPKRYDCIKVNFLGNGHVEWSHGKTRIIGNEKYVENSLLLWSPQQSYGGSIGPGSFSFQFQFVIPSHIPSSFGHQNTSVFNNGCAYISYEVEGRAVTGAFRFDHKASAPIFITRLTSISGPNQVIPVQEVKRKQVGCLCCAAGDVEFVAKLPRTGFCVTNCDVIPLMVNVQNNSTRVIRMKAEIMKRVALFVQDNENISWNSVADIYSEPIQPGASHVWNPANWIVPVLSPTLLGSGIINVDYVLEVSAVIPNAINLRCSIPLVMGNLPCVSSAESVEHAALRDAIVRSLGQSRASVNFGCNNEENFDDHNSSERDTLI